MRYFVHSGFINAWSLKKGLGLLGRELECAAARTVLLPAGDDQPAAGDVLFFTDECRLKQYLGRPEFRCLPPHSAAPLDDKLEFAQWLQEFDETPVPYWLDVGAPPAWPILVKARYSWLGARKLPQGYVCRTPLELHRALSRIDSSGLSRGCFFLQQWIPGCGNNVSTCGFFDAGDSTRTIIKVTRRVLASAGAVGTAAVVETIDDPAGLAARTHEILSRMDFVGPFELEFLYDAAQDRHYVLELNPRFWLQHGLFVDAFGNRVIENYLNRLGLIEPGEQATGEVPGGHAVWFSSIDAVRAILRGDVRALAAIAKSLYQARRRQARVCWHPDWPTTCRFVLRNLWKRSPSAPHKTETVPAEVPPVRERAA